MRMTVKLEMIILSLPVVTLSTFFVRSEGLSSSILIFHCKCSSYDRNDHRGIRPIAIEGLISLLPRDTICVDRMSVTMYDRRTLKNLRLWSCDNMFVTVSRCILKLSDFALWSGDYALSHSREPFFPDWLFWCNVARSSLFLLFRSIVGLSGASDFKLQWCTERN